MAPSAPVALILGAGANIGQHVARAFAAKGYKVAVAARSLEEGTKAGQLAIKADFHDPESVLGIFAKVKSELGVPHVVVYNAGAVHFQDKTDPLALPLKDLQDSLAVNLFSPFLAARQAVLGFRDLPDSAARTFIFTGNCTNVLPLPGLIDQGVGKAGTAHVIECAAIGYKDTGFKFYYADERNADGTPAYSKIDGEAHGAHYVKLAGGSSQEPWHQTFVKGVGYKKF